jgi:hypothetical protein
MSSILGVSLGQILYRFACVAVAQYGDCSTATAASNLSAIQSLCPAGFAHQFDKPISARNA